jgi:hypothetical protein
LLSRELGMLAMVFTYTNICLSDSWTEGFKVMESLKNELLDAVL